MKLIPRLFRRKEAPRNDIASSYELLQYLDSYARESAAGIRVNRNEALKCPAVAVSVKVISESVAQLPFNVFRVDKDGGRRVIDSNPAHKLLSQHGRPNSRQSAFEFKRWATREVALCGNAYALKQYVGDSLDALIPITRPVQVEENALGALVYRVARKDGTKAVYGQQDIFHLRGESDDCVTGIDPIKQNAEAIGLALAQDRFAAKMFSNGVKHSVVFKFPQALKEDSHKRLKESFEASYAGVDNAHKAIIVDSGGDIKEASMTLDEAQLLDSRKVQRSIVASLWRIPPHMVGDLEFATFSNIENLARQFVDYGLMPWIDMWQQAVEQQLLTPSQRASHIAKFNVNAFLRGDATSRSAFYNAGRTGEWLSANEVRENEDLPPREGGDEFKNPNINPRTRSTDAGKPEKSAER